MMPSAVVTDGVDGIPKQIACLSESACGDENTYTQATEAEAEACACIGTTSTCPRSTEAI